jgi:hypothetical protein
MREPLAARDGGLVVEARRRRVAPACRATSTSDRAAHARFSTPRRRGRGASARRVTPDRDSHALRATAMSSSRKRFCLVRSCGEIESRFAPTSPAPSRSGSAWFAAAAGWTAAARRVARHHRRGWRHVGRERARGTARNARRWAASVRTAAARGARACSRFATRAPSTQHVGRVRARGTRLAGRRRRRAVTLGRDVFLAAPDRRVLRVPDDPRTTWGASVLAARGPPHVARGS